MEIRSIQIDFDRDILKINGNECKTSPVIVSLPGLDGWQFKKLFNPELAAKDPEACDKLTLVYTQGINNRP